MPPNAQTPLERKCPRASCLAALLSVLGTLLLSATGQASRLTVPDDVPSVQAALNARPDTVLIRADLYPETTVVRVPVAIVGIPGSQGLERPTLLGMSFRLEYSPLYVPPYSVSGVTVRGPVYLQNDDLQASFSFQHCELLSGLIDQSGYISTYFVTLRGCRVTGGISVRLEDTCTIDSCAVEGGLTLVGPAASMHVTNSRFSGPGIGVLTPSEIYAATVIGTSFVSCGIGLDIGNSLRIHN